jgi:hypothetical protein
MRVLLDESLPLGFLELPAFVGHHVAHVRRSGMAGLRNGALHEAAQGACDLFVSCDRHFIRLGAVKGMGVIVIRIDPNVLELMQPAFEAFASAVDLAGLIGKLAVVWRDRWEIR